MAAEAEFEIIVKDTARNLYLRDIPMHRGQERWNSFKEKAYRFDNIEEAKEIIKLLKEKVPHIIYELVPKNADDSKGKLFGVEMVSDAGRVSTYLYWRSNSFLGALELSLGLAKKSSSELESVTITLREETNNGKKIHSAVA